MMSETGIFCVFCTCPDTDAANLLAEKLVENHLAACVNVLPGVTSYYRWQGQMERDSEVLLLIKCAEHSWQTLHDFVLREHPYDNPELVAVPVDLGSGSYLDWVSSECAPPKDNRH